MSPMCRVVLVVGWLVLAAFSSASPCEASEAMVGEGNAPFAIDLYIDPDNYNSEGIWTLGVTVQNGVPRGKGVAHVGLSPGVEVVKGDTVRSMAGAGTIWPWLIYLRRSPAVSRATLTGSIRIQGNDSTSYDIGQQIVELAFDGKGMQVLDKRTTREVAVRQGQRFRYGGMFMVPVDSDDVDDPTHFDSRAELLEGKPIECRGCGLDSTINVRVFVTVGRDGKVTGIPPPNPYATYYDHGNALPRLDAKLWPAVSDGVRRYKFRPAKVDGRTTGDWASLTVRVIPRK